MERTGVFPLAGLRSIDLTHLVAEPGPFTTVWLSVDAGVEQAAERTAIRWRSHRDEVAEHADSAVLEAMDRAVDDAHRHGPGLVLVADERALHLVEHLSEPPPHELVRWAPLPSLALVLAHRQDRIPHIVVLADRKGADLYGVSPAHTEHREAGGADHPITKVAPGGWSQRRYQQRAENTWEKNARDVATTVVELADAIRAELVIVAGDVRAVGLLREDLPDRVGSRLRHIPGGRAVDGSDDETAAEIRGLLRQAAAEQTAELMEVFHRERGRHDRAVEGWDATLGALTQARVDVLLLHDDGDDDREAWFVRDPPMAMLDPADDPGGGQGVWARRGDVAIACALATGAGVRITPGDAVPTEDVGALLRWSA